MIPRVNDSVEIEGKRKTESTLKVKERPFAKGSMDYSCATAFSFYKTEVKQF